MRSLLLALLAGALVLPAAGQGRIAFDTTRHDFGEIDEGDQASFVFHFHNEGDAPLTLQAVRPSCGCTAPRWPRQAVAPGAADSITVTYNSAGRPGAFHKSVAVVTDGDPELVHLYIDGTVRPLRLADGVRQGQLVFEKDALDLGAVSREWNVVGAFLLQHQGERVIRFLSADAADAPIQVDLPATPLFPDDVAEIAVTLRTADLPAGQPFDYPVVLLTDDPDQPEKTLRIRGNVE